jgi:hypothetical protein
MAVATPRAEQAYDLVRRLAELPHPPLLQLLQSSGRAAPQSLASNPRVQIVTQPRDLHRVPGVVISTAHKLAFSATVLGPDSFDVLTGDEAYQLAAKDFDPLLHLAKQTFLVGDPGQLPPLIKADVALFEAAPYKVHWPAPKELLRRRPDAEMRKLLATRRLPSDSARLVQPAFYPDLPFVSLADDEQRRVAFDRPGLLGDSLDRALDMVAQGASIVAVLLPAREVSPGVVDDEVAALAADVTARFLDRGARWMGERLLMPADIGAIDAHVASGAAMRRQLRQRGVPTDQTKVDTPEIWQGLERPIMVVKHPLSGKKRLDLFDLEPGRWCVMLSRHLLSCVIVGRDGVSAALEQHAHACDRVMGADDSEWSGREAHWALWSQLEQDGRIIRL